MKIKGLLLTVVLQFALVHALQAAKINLDECISLARSNYPTIKKPQKPQNRKTAKNL